MKRKIIFSLLAVLGLGIALGGANFAAAQSGSGRGGMPPGNSQGSPLGKGMGPMNISDEAISACESKSEKDSCSFTNSDDKSISGNCRKNPKDEDALFCAPEMKEGMGPKGEVQSQNREENRNSVEAQITMAEKMKTREADNFERVETRLEKLIEFLDSKEIDTDTLEADLETFKTKSSAVLAAIDSYADILDELDDAGTTSLTDEAKTAREAVKTAMESLKSFYKDTLKVDIKAAVDKISE